MASPPPAAPTTAGLVAGRGTTWRPDVAIRLGAAPHAGARPGASCAPPRHYPKALAVVASAVLTARGRSSAHRRGGDRAALVVVHAAGNEDASASGDAIGGAAASKLELEAARVREEVAALERAAADDRRAARARQLLGDDKSIGARELQARLKDVVDLDLSVEQAEILIGSCKNGRFDASLSYDDLVTACFEAEVDKQAALQAEARRRERERPAKSVEQKGVQDAVQGFLSPGSEADDADLVARILASLAYLLPLVDGIPYAIPLAYIFPASVYLLEPIAVLGQFINAIPFGSFIILIALSTLSRNADLPRLVRFNLQQAVVIDVLMILPGLIRSFLGLDLPGELTLAVFVLLFGSIVYSVLFTLFGRLPDNLGAISEATKRNLGPF